MKKLLNKNLILIFAIFALVLSFSLTNTVSARTVTVDFGANTEFDHWNNDNSGNNNSNNNSGNTNNNTNNTQNTSLVPHITSISPTSGITKTGAKDITINGYNFIPGSVARWNGSDRNTSYVSSSQIIMHTTDADMTGLGSQSITVYNHTSNGGLSNTAYYTLKKAPTTSATTTSKPKPSSTAKPKTTTTPACVSETTDEDTDSNLAANALFSSDSFLPTSFLGWLLLIILVLLIVIVWRKLTHAGEKYKAQPLKHA
ncbi:MAG TPA: IPT/TIG domain-containing protein [Candidatus Paceibacterota bacterium]|mgnify:CR=1 FL=1|nr:IPT/TIG domain-containing protein [Candidatus Paceibacterota bacterium]